MLLILRLQILRHIWILSALFLLLHVRSIRDAISYLLFKEATCATCPINILNHASTWILFYMLRFRSVWHFSSWVQRWWSNDLRKMYWCFYYSVPFTEKEWKREVCAFCISGNIKIILLLMFLVISLLLRKGIFVWGSWEGPPSFMISASTLSRPGIGRIHHMNINLVLTFELMWIPHLHQTFRLTHIHKVHLYILWKSSYKMQIISPQWLSIMDLLQ